MARTRALDPTRHVNDNDGWEHIASTDIMSAHDYDKDGAGLAARWGTLEGKAGEHVPKAHKEAMVRGAEYGGQPLLVTEYGGIAYKPGDGGSEEWGYHGVETDEEAFLRRFEGVHRALYGAVAVQGFCYTQITDVEQEINGLADYHRRPKVAPERIARIVRGE